MGDGMRGLKVAVVVMGVLIVLGTIGLAIGIVRRSGAPMVAVAPLPAMTATPLPAMTAAPLPAMVSAVLDEPAGTRIAGIVAVRERLAVQLQGGGVDRVVLIDPVTGAVAGRISLAR
jgi:hypothetical protein